MDGNTAVIHVCLPHPERLTETVRRSSPLLTSCLWWHSYVLLTGYQRPHWRNGRYEDIWQHSRTTIYTLPLRIDCSFFFANINCRVSLLSYGMRSCKSSKLLQYQGVCSHKFYRFQGEELTKDKALNRHITELASLRSFDSLNKTDVIWSSTETEDMKAAARSIVEATSWMD